MNLFAIWIMLSQVDTTLPSSRTPIPTTSRIKYGGFDSAKAMDFLLEMEALGNRLTDGKMAEEYRFTFGPEPAPDGTRFYYISAVPKDKPQRIIIYFSGLSATYKVDSGRLQSFAYASHPGESKFSIEECLRRSADFYRIGGGSSRLGKPYIDVFGDGDPTAEQLVDFVFDQYVVGSVYPVGPRVQITMNRVLGLPSLVTLSEVPPYVPATRILPALELSSIASQIGQQGTGWASVILGTTGPRYEIPSFMGLGTRLEDEDRETFLKGKARLVQEFSVNDQSSYDAATRRYDRFVQISLDAQTGRLLAFVPAYRMMGGHSDRNTAFSVEGRTWTLGSSSGLLRPTGTATAPSSAKRIPLRSGLREWIYPAYADGNWYINGKVYVSNPRLKSAADGYRPNANFNLVPVSAPKG